MSCAIQKNGRIVSCPCSLFFVFHFFGRFANLGDGEVGVFITFALGYVNQREGTRIYFSDVLKANASDRKEEDSAMPHFLLKAFGPYEQRLATQISIFLFSFFLMNKNSFHISWQTLAWLQCFSAFGNEHSTYTV